MDSIDVDVHNNPGQICFVTAAGEGLPQRIHAQRAQFGVVLPRIPQPASSPRHPPRARSKGIWIHDEKNVVRLSDHLDADHRRLC
jgi:hypothetical protein